MTADSKCRCFASLRRGAFALLASLLALAATPPRSDAQANAYAALVAAAKQEGTVVVDGPALDLAREELTQGFERRFGITVAYISSGASPSAARVRAERAAGKYLLDVFVSGSDTPTVTFRGSGWLDPVQPALIAPDVVNPKAWKDGHLWFVDPQHDILRTVRYVTDELAVNTKLVKPGEVTTWKSLLDPKWKGKLIVKDPTVAGAGASLISYFYLTFGPDFVRKLYKDQQPVLTRDARQAAQWLSQGNYPILVGPDFSLIQEFAQMGYPVAPVLPTDGPGVLSGGYGLICLMNKAPHPNAAKLFINWLAGREGQTALAKSTAGLSLRTDIAQTWAPAFEFPRPGVKYLDTYDYNFIIDQRNAAYAKVRELLGM